jgi:outer membrane protein TolC
MDSLDRNGRIVAILLFVSSLTCLPGCRFYNGFLKPVGPDYCPPGAPIAAEWIEQTNPQVISDSQGVDDPAWWHVFDDPVLSQLVYSVYQQNLPLRTAGQRVLQARYQRNIAASRFFPQRQQVFGDYSRDQISTNTVPQNLDPPGFLPRSFDNWATGFDASWELDV